MTTLSVSSMKIGERYMVITYNKSFSATLVSKFAEPEVQYVFANLQLPASSVDKSLHTIPGSFITHVYVFAYPTLPWSINRLISEYV